MASGLLSMRRVGTVRIGNGSESEGGDLFLFVKPRNGKRLHFRHRKARRVRRPHAAGQCTFREVAGQWVAANDQWSVGYVRQVRSYLDRDILPAIGGLPVEEVTPLHVRAIVESVAGRGARCAALLVSQWISQIFSHAVLKGLREDDPARLLKGLVKRPTVRHHPPLAWPDIPGFFECLEAWSGRASVKIALRLLALTFVRPSELRLARWEEFDLANRLWTIPKERMKMRRVHMVPLSRQAVTLLRALRAQTGDGAVLFPNHHAAGRALSASTFNRAIDCLGYGGRFSAHGFRATATTLLGLLGYPDKLVDLQLAHRRRDTSRAPYDHARFVGSRTLLMQDWADILDALMAGQHYAQVSQAFGPLSRRRTRILRVIERE